MAVKNVIKRIKNLKGVLDVQELSNEDRKALIEIESHRKENIIPVVNEGLDECMKRDFFLIMLKNKEFRYAPEPTVLLVTDKGRILGQELISDEEKKKYQDQDDVYFLSGDFIVFKPDKTAKRIMGEKEFFLLPPIPFPELNGIEGINEVISCSPSTMGDSYLKNKYGYPDDPNLATIIIGFSKKKENE